jgi:undecaprenyl pyrophosphate synthase
MILDQKFYLKLMKQKLATDSYKPVLNLNVALGYGGRQDIVNCNQKNLK